MIRGNNENNTHLIFTCSKLTIETLEKVVKFVQCHLRHLRCSGVFIVNFEQISHVSLAFLLLNLRR